MISITPIASGSTGNCWHITDGKTSILLDAGAPVKALQAHGVMPSSVSAALVTHEHQDHCKYAKELARRGVQIIEKYKYVNDCTISAWHSLGTFDFLAYPVSHDV
ncbi:MAG: MBL fold metallo-hydrolase, partial [Oscillospiraceae bacterium]|nr:MBL fold metallo-hydrolase [Oscillospiraceae bacterium]